MKLSISDVKGIAGRRFNKMPMKTGNKVTLWSMLICLVISVAFLLPWVLTIDKDSFKVESPGIIQIQDNNELTLDGKILTPEPRDMELELLIPGVVFLCSGFILFFGSYLGVIFEEKKFTDLFIQNYVDTGIIPEDKG